MSTELVVALVSSFVAFFVAVASIWAGVVNAKRADKRAEKQTQADLKKLMAEHAHALAMWRAESAESRHQEIRDRLQREAAEYIALLAEIHDITAEMHDFLNERATYDDWHGSGPAPDRWNTQIRERLTMMTARLTLYGGEVAAAAIRARDQVLRHVDEWNNAIENYEGINTYVDLSLSTEGFAGAVTARLDELNDHAR